MPKTIYVNVQEGGSSREFYVHAYNSEKRALEGKKECEEASYRVVGPVEMPAKLRRALLSTRGSETELYSFLQGILEKVSEL